MNRWLMLLVLCAAPVVSAQGASRPAGPAISVLGGGNVEAILTALAPDFERTTNQSLSMAFGRASELRARIEAGEMADVVVIMRSDLDALARARRVAPETVVNVARSAIGVAVRAGTPMPDMRSREAVTRALVNAPSLAYADPARGTTSGLFVTSLLENLGIAERVRAKTTLVVSDRPVGEAVASRVARGDAALGIGQLSEMLPVAGIAFVSPLAKELQPDLLVAAGVTTDARNRDGALTFIRCLLSPRGAAVFNARGMTPP